MLDRSVFVFSNKDTHEREAPGSDSRERYDSHQAGSLGVTMSLIGPWNVILRNSKQYSIHEETERTLLMVPPEKWTPILLEGRKVIDGNQRVLIARKHCISMIPFRLVEK